MKSRPVRLALLAILSTILVGLSNKLVDIRITTSGIDELGVELAPAYGTRSLQHVLLTNNGPHHLLACEILFEVTTRGGQVLSARKNIYSASLMEKDSAKRKVILGQEQVITPRSKWLIGFGDLDMEPVRDKVPPLAEVGGDENLFPDAGEYVKLNIVLGGVITEDGKARGPRVQEFLRHMDEDLKELAEDRK